MGVREGYKENHAESRSRLKVLSVGALTISIGSLFQEMGSLTENAAFLRSRRKLRWRNLDSSHYDPLHLSSRMNQRIPENHLIPNDAARIIELRSIH